MSYRRHTVVSLTFLCSLILSSMLTLISLPGASAQSGATPESGDAASLFTAPGITSRVLGNSNAATLAIVKPHLLFERITFGQNVKLPARLLARKSPRAMARRIVRSFTPRSAAASRAESVLPVPAACPLSGVSGVS